jgi:hypothetical protein
LRFLDRDASGAARSPNARQWNRNLMTSTTVPTVRVRTASVARWSDHSLLQLYFPLKQVYRVCYYEANKCVKEGDTSLQVTEFSQCL